MLVPFQASVPDNLDAPPKGAAARTRALMVMTASAMMRRGLSPSVSEVAEAAGVSRSTAYRYFPTLADMLRAVVSEALGPILDWDDPATEGAARLASLYGETFARLAEHEATFRAALRQSLEPSLEAPGDKSLGRGHRKALLARAVSDSGLNREQSERLVNALSLTFGIEAMIVLKDICGLDDDGASEVAIWAAQAMLLAARREAEVEQG
ncbi:TetR/AcrR family transcriptional regulator [Tabrizicola piscis]|uniref:TetR/AcrR family transcriptional regulator n=1 Tax=Tabrizicola piscis TaxID=2494374 RepID=A0A3S8U3M7_9RHOB|nr:TetR/AcrR family transcriptional regulator [Tabrizicola piscis]AZL58175.1 TetR/AcrR family transcriptional regulator [Tabrizicola piscis]